MKAKVPASASGTVMLAMNVGQNRRRNRKMTITTSAMLSSSENCTSCTEARIVVVRSLISVSLIDGGIHFLSCGSTARMRSTVSITLASACLKMMTSTARLVPDQPATRAFSVPSMARPSALSRMGALLRCVRIRSW